MSKSRLHAHSALIDELTIEIDLDYAILSDDARARLRRMLELAMEDAYNRGYQKGKASDGDVKELGLATMDPKDLRGNLFS